MSISLIVKKFIAGIIALLMPITTTIAVNQPQNTPVKTDFHASEVSKMPISEDDFVSANIPTEEEIANETPAEEAPAAVEEEAAPAEETTAPAEEAPVEEAPAPVEEATVPETTEATTQANAPVAEWDVSNTDNDDVHMYYYDENDPSLLDTVTASVKALFVPITAYAETTTTEYAEETAVDDKKYEKGTVVIDGEGATQEMLFLNWLNADRFVASYEQWCEEKNHYNDAYILREYISNETGEFTGPGTHMDAVHELYMDLPESEANKEILKVYVPTYISNFVMENENFWQECADFIPEHVIINGNVTDISFAAFAFCTQIKDITINANVERVHSLAFGRTGITEITLPVSVKEIGSSVFVECTNLQTIHVNGPIDNCASDAFSSLPMGSRIVCDNYSTYANIAKIDAATPMAMENGANEITSRYNRRTTVVYTAPAQDELL